MANRPLLDAIATQRATNLATAQATLAGLTEAQLAHDPGRGRWSAGMIADHLVKVNGPMLASFRNALEGAPLVQAGHEDENFSMLERMMIRSLGPNSPVKVPVPPLFEPAAPSDPVATVRELLELLHAYNRLVEDTRRRDVRGIKVSSVALSRLRLSYLGFLTGLTEHDAYHLGQVTALIEEGLTTQA